MAKALPWCKPSGGVMGLRAGAVRGGPEPLLAPSAARGLGGRVPRSDKQTTKVASGS
jgi:hypothetical protein